MSRDVDITRRIFAAIRPRSAYSCGAQSTPWMSMIRKEWHEHKAKAALVTLLAASCVFMAGGSASAIGVGGLLGCGGALFLAMGVVAGERADGSLEFGVSLPVKRWKAAFVRIAVSAVLCLLPVLVSSLLIRLAPELLVNRATSHGLWLSALHSSGLCLSFYLWVTAAGAMQPTPLRVGLVGVFVGLMWFTILLVLQSLRNEFGATWVELVSWVGPAGWMMNATVPPTSPSSTFLLVQAISMCALFSVSVLNCRYPLHEEGCSPAPNGVLELDRLGHLFRSPSRALAWLHFREALPLGAGGFAMLMVLGLVIAVLLSQRESVLGQTRLVQYTVFGIGIPWMVVSAVGTFGANLRRPLFTFWRSQPIPIVDWFWSKFWIGAAISLLSLHLPVILLVGVTHKIAWRDPIANCIGYLLLPLSHLMVYSLAVMVTVFLRRVTSAAILSFSAALLFLGLPMIPGSSLEFLRFDRAQGSVTEFFASSFNGSAKDFVPFLVCTIATTIVSAGTSAVALQRDIWLTSSQFRRSKT